MKRNKVEWIASGYPNIEDWLGGFIKEQYNYSIIKMMYRKIKSSVPEHMHIRPDALRTPFELRTPDRYIAVLQYYWRTKRNQIDNVSPIPHQIEIPLPLEGMIRIRDPDLTYQEGVLRNGVPLPSAPPVGPIRTASQQEQQTAYQRMPSLQTLQIPAWIRQAQSTVVEHPRDSTFAPSAPPLPPKIRVCLAPQTALSEPTCSICLTAEPYYRTQCGHEFCSCLLQHLVEYKRSACPLCRTPVESINTPSEPCYQSMRIVGQSHFDF